METTNRTRAEIQAEIEKLEQELENTWPQKGAQAYCKAEVADSEDDDAEILIYGTDCFTTVPLASLIPAADLIPREEHERAVAEAVKEALVIDGEGDVARAAKIVVAHEAKHGTFNPWITNHEGQHYRVTVERVVAKNATTDNDHIVDATKKVENAEPRYHDDSAVNKAFALAELKTMTPEAFVEWLKADKPGPIAQLIQAAQGDAEPVGWANRMSDGAWSGVYASKETARSVAEYGGWDEIAVPLYRHPAPIPAPQATADADPESELLGYAVKQLYPYINKLSPYGAVWPTLVEAQKWLAVYQLDRHGKYCIVPVYAGTAALLESEADRD